MDDPNLIPATPEGDALEEQISRSLVDSLSDDAPGAPDDAEDVLAALDGTLTDLPETNKINETDAPADGEPEQDAAQAVETVDETAEAPSEPPQEDAAEPLGEEEKENEKEEPAAVPAAPKKAGRAAKYVFLGAMALCFAFGAGSLAARFVRESNLLSQDTLYRVSVGGTDLSDMTRDEAKAALDEAFSSDRFNRKIVFRDGKTTYREKISRFDPKYDTAAALDEAWNFGRTGSRREKLHDVYLALGAGRDFAVPCEISEDAAAEYATELAAQIDCEVQEPSIEVNPENDGVNNLFLMQEERVGRKLDQSALVDAIVTANETDFAPIELSVAETQPKETLASLQENVQLMRTFTTQYAYVSSRVYNIHRATDAINGTVIQPGEEFSFNGVVGNTSLAENGYREAGVIIGGRSATGRGGGVCQAATTLYNAAVRCDMEITQRAPHAIASTYVPKGQDATIAYGYYDMAFRNTSDHPIYIFGSYTNTSVTFMIYGKPLEDGVSIEMESEMLGTRYPGEAKVTVDRSKPVGYRETVVSALNGYDVRVYKLWLDKDGNEIKRVVDHVDAYPTRRAEITVGGAQPAPTPAPDPAPVEGTGE